MHIMLIIILFRTVAVSGNYNFVRNYQQNHFFLLSW